MENSANLKLIMLFQLLTRLLTFLMNNLIARSTSATNLGLITLKLDLLGNTVMALGRDGIRMAALRESKSEERLKAKWLTLILVTVIGSLCSCAYLWFVSEPIIIQHFNEFRVAVAFYFASTVLESLTESSVVELIISKKFKRKISIESTALILKISFILYSIMIKRDDRAELSLLMGAFSKGQFIYAVSLNLLHYGFGSQGESSSIFVLPSAKFFNLASALTRQNFFKYFLAQGDLFIISSCSSLKDQGVYAVVSNYGSLVLRLIMQPIEEASLQYFSQATKDRKNENVIGYFNLMLKSLIYFGLLFICFGSFFTDPVIFFLLGRKWSNDTVAANTLSAYCWLVAAAGVSGFMESFVNAVIDEDGMRQLRWISVGCSIVYCVMAVGFIYLKGSMGLVIASATNFAIRAAINASIIQGYWTKMEGLRMSIWDSLTPEWNVLGSFLFVFIINLVLFIFWRWQWKLRISIGICLFMNFLVILFRKDNKFTKEFLQHWRK